MSNAARGRPAPTGAPITVRQGTRRPRRIGGPPALIAAALSGAVVAGLAAAAGTDTVAVSATKPPASFEIELRNAADTADVTSLAFGALTRGTTATSAPLIVKVNAYNVAGGSGGVWGQNIRLNFSLANVPAGYAVQLSYDGGTPSNIDPWFALWSWAPYGATVGQYYDTLEQLRENLSDADLIRVHVTASGAAQQDLNGTITFTLTAP